VIQNELEPPASLASRRGRKMPQGAAKKKLAKARGRSVTEWVGRTPDTRVPPHVRLRVFDRAGGKCHISGRKIDGTKDKWDLDHIRRLDDGGENRESNLAPVLKEPHKTKTAAETRAGKKADRARMKQVGIKKETQPIPQRPKPEKPPAKPLPPRRGGIFAQYFGKE
jgi:5-methylcytosine-specific restriction protein A